MNAHLSLATSVVLSPRRNGLCAGLAQEVDVLLRVQAPAAPAGHVAQRPPQALALVIDRSGSMTGRPLEEAKRCAESVLGQLRPGDAAALVQFDHRVQRLWPATALGDGAAQRAAVAGIQAGGNTDLHGGWIEGASALDECSFDGLRRVILLSDGQANHGLTDSSAISAQCAAWAARGISTSTYGLGQHFNEELMLAMARAGGGNHYYGESAEDLMAPFQEELALLGNVCLRELRLNVTLADGFSVETLNPLPLVGTAWCLPDLAWGAEAWAVLRVKVPAAALRKGGAPCTLLRVNISARSLEGEAVTLERTSLALPVLTPAAFNSLVDDELVTRRLLELAAADALLAMRRAAAAGDWVRVDALLAAARRQFAGHAWVAAVLESMQALAASREQERTMKETLYSSAKLSSRLVPHVEEAAFDADREVVLPIFLRRKPAQGKGDA